MDGSLVVVDVDENFFGDPLPSSCGSLNDPQPLEASLQDSPEDDLLRFVVKDEDLSKFSRKIQSFYKHQNDLVHSMISLERDAEGDSTDKDIDVSSMERKKKIAIYGSASVNVFLFLIKIFAAVTSGSLTVIASALDSFLDLLSGCIIFFTDYVAGHMSKENYPVGKARFEPLGLVIFSSCMFTATCQLLLSCVKALIFHDQDKDISIATFCILIVVIVCKTILYLFCKTVKSPSVQALAMDHRNDVLTNSFGLLVLLFEKYLWWGIDPIGAATISIYVLFIWGRTCYEQIKPLTGAIADEPHLVNSLIYLAQRHHGEIIGIDTVRVYYLGYKYAVELDIILHPDTLLRKAHDIGESLQNKLEKLFMIERAFVHIDYEGEHKPEHG